ncbi:hypothetical protein PIB30_098325 [Stylosanthes scabra]|uniref:Uncharacterized protein n=1 Tax=Stylosanthes scabra TaxID=79078 RepID=A0ABU6QVX9_9FABA|nr:hypothetical protein [Stylosanthes scabra]
MGTELEDQEVVLNVYMAKDPGVSGAAATASASSGTFPPPVSTPSTWPPFGLPHNYSPPYDTTSRGGLGFNPRSNLHPNPQYSTQEWYPPPPQGGNYGYLNNPQPPFAPFGTGGGAYNPPIFGTFPQPLMNNPPQFGPIHLTTPVIQPMPTLQPSQATISIPQMVLTGANRPIFLEMSRKMPIEPNHVNNIVESLAVFTQQIEKSHHDLVNMLTQQMATVLTPMIENNNARIEQVAQQVIDLA